MGSPVYINPFAKVGTEMRIALWLTIGVLFIGYGITAFITLDRSSDEAQITSLVRQANNSVHNRNLSELVSCVSKDYKDEAGLNYDRVRMLLAQALRNETEFTVNTITRSIRIEGSKATLELHVTLKRGGNEAFYDRDITVILHKEAGHHAIFIPVKMWRVVGTQNLGLSMGDNTF